MDHEARTLQHAGPSLPTFLYIGPPKSASSWLYAVLTQHPEVYVPPAKDLYFFDRFYDQGIQWYARYFRPLSPRAKVIGELSHDYLYSEEACYRILRDLPEVRLISILRNPVDRAVSHYMHSLRNGSVSADFERAVEENPSILTHGLYGRYLTPYFKAFGSARLGVFFFDDLVSDCHAFARDVFGFLGIDPSVEVDVDRRVNVASTPRSASLARAAHIAAKALRLMGMANALGNIKRGPVRRLFYRPATQREKPVLSDQTRRRLADYYRNDIAVVERLTARDLSRWRG